MTWTKRWQKRLRALLRKEDVERELDEELAFHLEMEAQKNLHAGMSPEEARRRAALTFGGMEKFKEEVRDARTLGWVTGTSLDVRLGVRMLAKHPGLTVVGGLGMAVAIAVATSFFAVLYSYMLPDLPLEEGDRVVGIENWDASISNNERPTLGDFFAWREELTSVEDLGAYRTIGRNLIVPGGAAEPVSAAEITASAFRVARVPPLLGRHLVEEDQRQGAPSVVVIGYDAWQRSFRSDPAVVGREIRLGSAVHTVVGVMPEGFAFPMSHRFWVPLRVDASSLERGGGPEVTVFGRLAPGATLERARAELEAVGRRTAAAFPATHGQIRPRLLPYPSLFMDGTTRAEVHLAQLLISLLLVVVAVNVAVLVYARTASRRGEIAVRVALGATRRRIVTQLFAEALVLSAAAGLVGLALVRLALWRIDASLAAMDGLPFWIRLGMSPGTVAYALALSLLGAAIVGVVPALQATGRGMQASLREVGGGGGGLRMGGTWTALIVAQVAFAVAVLPAAVHMGEDWLRFGFSEPGFAAEEYLMADVALDREDAAGADAEAERSEFAGRLADRLAELERRLEAESGVAAVTYADAMPGSEPVAWIEVDGLPAPPGAPFDYSLAEGTRIGHPVRTTRVGGDYFEAFGVRALGDPLPGPGGASASRGEVVVNRSFVQRILGGADALGSRFRYVGRGGDAPADLELGPWHEIVGVVEDFPRAMAPSEVQERVYHRVAPGTFHPVTLAVRTRGAGEDLGPRLRGIAGQLDPTLQLRDVQRLDEALRQGQAEMRMAAGAVALVTLSVLLLSAAGIYALISFTVTRRRREIGIRVALGAHPHRILVGVFGRALRQLALGLAAGVVAAALLDRLLSGDLMGGRALVVLPGVAALMVAVGLLAALGPARRGLRIQPTEALRAE